MSDERVRFAVTTDGYRSWWERIRKIDTKQRVARMNAARAAKRHM